MKKRKIQQFNEDPLLKEKAFNRAVYLMTEQEEKEEYWRNGKQKGIQEGIQEGIQKGKREGKYETLISMTKSKYPHADLNWLTECSEVQFNYIQQLLLQSMEYEEFYEKIHQLVS